MDENFPKMLAEKKLAYLITPAGCGKTETIVRAVSYSDSMKGKQLILTHTHAGVRSLHDRFRKLRISRKLYHVDTIAGFALQYAASFPVSSGLGLEFDPISREWNNVYAAARTVISSNAGKRIIGASYCGMYVDEYQDCTPQQHILILALAEIIPCRILGDPLQGIFGFKNNPIVNWYDDVFPVFADRVGGKDWTPWRWKGKNEDLGIWLYQVVRNNLLKGLPIDLHTLPKGVNRLELNTINQFNACMNKLKRKDETVVAIHRLAQHAHNTAMKLKGLYSSMEEVESKDLMKWADKLENLQGIDKAIAILDFAEMCMTAQSLQLRFVRKKIENAKDVTKAIQHQDIFQDLRRVVNSSDLMLMLTVIEKIEKIEGRILYRPELWHGMRKAVKEKVDSKADISLQKIAWMIRDKERFWGKAINRHVVSRTLLIKGLEFDHCIVLNADELDAKELYVALTRGSRTLTIISSESTLQKAIPTDLMPPKKQHA